VRRPWRHCREEHQVARFEGIRIDARAHTKLTPDVAGHGDAMLLEDVLNEAAAVEPAGIGAAVAIRGATKR
jgi:hypothetical protein